MSFISQKKGVVLVVVGVLVLLFAVAEITIFSIIKYRLKHLEGFLNDMRAYYAMESVATVAVEDISVGNIGRGVSQWTERDIVVDLRAITVSAHYTITKVAGVWRIECSTSDPSLGGRTYHLTFGGRRAFPVFIWGHLGGK